jgi:hypothetical protein
MFIRVVHLEWVEWIINPFKHKKRVPLFRGTFFLVDWLIS